MKVLPIHDNRWMMEIQLPRTFKSKCGRPPPMPLGCRTTAEAAREGADSRGIHEPEDLPDGDS